jgi:hypothetical protein
MTMKELSTLKPSQIANAAAGTFAVLGIGCLVIFAFVPWFYMTTAHSWSHGSGMMAPMAGYPGGFAFGWMLYALVTFTLVGYISGLVFAYFVRMQTRKS